MVILLPLQTNCPKCLSSLSMFNVSHYLQLGEKEGKGIYNEYNTKHCFIPLWPWHFSFSGCTCAHTKRSVDSNAIADISGTNIA